MNEKELKLWMRSICYVVDYFDEERTIPWNYVRRTADGRFEAFATHLVEGIGGVDNEARERSIGVFGSCDLATKALREYTRRVARAEYSWRLPDGQVDLNAPTKH